MRNPRPSRAKDRRRKPWRSGANGKIVNASIHALRQIREEQQSALFVWPHEGTFTTNKETFVFTDDRQDFEPMLIDLFTASAILRVYQHVNDDNRAKFERMIKGSRGNFLKIASFCLDRVS